MQKQSITKTSGSAKKRLKDVTFDHEGAHLALCSKEQGAANNQNTALVLKADKFSPELIAKAQRVQVTMELPDFLEKFFDLWYSDAQVLARLMGYKPEEEEQDTYEDWIDERVKSFTLLKSLHEAESLPSALAALTEEQYSMILDDQEKIAKSIKEFEASNSVDNSTQTKVDKAVEPVGSKQVNKGKRMTKEVEMIEKSKFETIEKALQAQAEELTKAREQLQALEKEKAQSIIKQRSDSLQTILKDEKNVEVVMKAIGAMSAEDFDAVVGVFKSQAELLEKSDLFSEKGVTVDNEEKPAVNPLRAELLKKYAKQD